MKTKKRLLNILLMLSFPCGLFSQNSVDFTESQTQGYLLTGMGLSTIGYTAFGYSDIGSSHIGSAAFYVVGGALLTAGVAFLIFVNKKKPDKKYWKGMGFREIPLFNRKDIPAGTGFKRYGLLF